jgi:hypothetical protein
LRHHRRPAKDNDLLTGFVGRRNAHLITRQINRKRF